MNDVIRRSQRSPTWFVSEVLGQHLWSKQREIAESVRDHTKTAVRSGHGPGKTYTAACVALWFLFSFPEARVITTATTGYQVRDLLWREVGRLARGARFPLGGQILQTRIELPDGRFAVGLSPRKENMESFQGHHEEHVLFIFDEASGIESVFFDAAEGSMTTAGARWLLIGNPTRPQGEFYSAFRSKRAEYNTIKISAFDTPNFTGEKVPDKVAAGLVSKLWVEGRKKAWGVDHPLYQVKVLGDFPKQADNAVIGLGDVEAAQERDLPVIDPEKEKCVGCDVARFGTDETTIYTRHDRKVRLAQAYIGRDTMQTAGHVAEHADKLKADYIVVDDTGVGGGVTDRLRELGYNVTAFVASETAIDEDKYPNARSELWFRGAEMMPELDIDKDDEQLAGDLVAPIWKLDSRSRRQVEPKDKTKERLGRSPDRGDGLLLSLVPEQTLGMEVW